MKRKLISAVALIMCAIMFLFCGCKSKKNGDDTTAPSESGAAVDAVTDESTEPSSEETTEPEKKEPASDAVRRVTDISRNPGHVNTTTPSITSQCLRVPVSDGHMAAVFFSLENKISKEEIIERWEKFRGPAQELELPSAPKQFLHYFTEDNRPQPKLDRDLEGGMAVSIGRLRPDTQYDYKFVCLSHNTLRGAAGGALLMAELLAAKGYFD